MICYSSLGIFPAGLFRSAWSVRSAHNRIYRIKRRPMGCSTVSNVSQIWALPSLTGRHCEIFLSIFSDVKRNTRDSSDTLITVLPSFFQPYGGNFVLPNLLYFDSFSFPHDMIIK